MPRKVPVIPTDFGICSKSFKDGFQWTYNQQTHIIKLPNLSKVYEEIKDAVIECVMNDLFEDLTHELLHKVLHECVSYKAMDTWDRIDRPIRYCQHYYVSNLESW